MNKKLLAIAVGAAMIAGATAATAGEAELYGKIHMSIDSMDNDVADDPLTVANESQDGIFVSSNSSRLGIKGSEDLGNGLSVVYKYEMQTDYSSVKLDGSRNAYAGLKGGFGQVELGVFIDGFLELLPGLVVFLLVEIIQADGKRGQGRQAFGVNFIK